MMRLALFGSVVSANDISVNLIPRGGAAGLSGFLKKQQTETSHDVSNFEASFNRMIGSASHAAFAEFAAQEGVMEPLMAKLRSRLIAGGHYTKTAADRLLELGQVEEYRNAMKNSGMIQAATNALEQNSISDDTKSTVGAVLSMLKGGRASALIFPDPISGGNGKVQVYLSHPGASLAGIFDRTTQAPMVWVSGDSALDFQKKSLMQAGFAQLDVFVGGQGSSNFGEAFQSSLAPVAKRTNLLRKKKSFSALSDGISGPLQNIAAEMAQHSNGGNNGAVIQQLLDQAKSEIAGGNGGVNEAVGNAGRSFMQSNNVPNTDEVRNRLAATAPMPPSAISVNIFDN